MNQVRMQECSVLRSELTHVAVMVSKPELLNAYVFLNLRVHITYLPVEVGNICPLIGSAQLARSSQLSCDCYCFIYEL